MVNVPWDHEAHRPDGLSRRPERDEVVLDYTNHRGERAERHVRPVAIIFRASGTQYHPEPGWYLMAHDHDRREPREFAMASIHSWRSA